jgi:peptide/nickel transport system permease protein
MAGILGRRLVGSALLILASSFVVFSLIYLAPGDPVSIILGGRHVDEATREAIRQRYHFDQPFLAQYLSWLANALQGDLGKSVALQGASVSGLVVGRILPTLQLALYASLLVAGAGLTLGIVTAVRRGGRVDAVGSLGMLIGASMSPYVTGILLILVFSVNLRLFPVFGLGEGIGDRIYHLTLPAFALALALVALLGRVTRASLSQALNREYVETARSRGFSERRVVLKHALRSAAVPVVTVMGVIMGYLISGAVLVEYTFGLNGLGALLVDGVLTKDFAVVQGVILVFTVAFLVINLVVDLLYYAIDPRTRLARGTR